MKEFEKSVKICQSYCQEFGGPVFLEHSVLLFTFATTIFWKFVINGHVVYNFKHFSQRGSKIKAL